MEAYNIINNIKDNLEFKGGKKILWLISTLLLITSCTGKKTNVNKSKIIVQTLDFSLIIPITDAIINMAIQNHIFLLHI